jgi:hypothetical protein
MEWIVVTGGGKENIVLKIDTTHQRAVSTSNESVASRLDITPPEIEREAERPIDNLENYNLEQCGHQVILASDIPCQWTGRLRPADNVQRFCIYIYNYWRNRCYLSITIYRETDVPRKTIC